MKALKNVLDTAEKVRQDEKDLIILRIFLAFTNLNAKFEANEGSS
jgi:hypothetical protein